MNQTLPTHIGYIVDGNRRWAKQQGLDARKGHEAGFEALKDVLIETLHKGVRYASAYVFSTENWKRSEREVKYLIQLFIEGLKREEQRFIDENVRVRIVGSRDKLGKSVLRAIDRIERVTAELTGGNLLLCFNYGGQLEVVEAVQQIVREGISPDEITQQTISDRLYAPDAPPCDVIVRTSGEMRLSNFMMWRSAYSEMMFIDKNWPDMTKLDVQSILDEYSKRQRRYGG